MKTRFLSDIFLQIKKRKGIEWVAFLRVHYYTAKPVN